MIRSLLFPIFILLIKIWRKEKFFSLFINFLKCKSIIMVTHVGFTTTTETLSTYNTETGEEESIDLPLNLSKFNDIEIYTLLGAIIAKAKTIGCVCLCVDADISNETRKEIFAHAQRLGINDLTIINHTTAMYSDVMYQKQIIPEVGDYVWVQYDSYFYIWQYTEEGAHLVTTWEFEKMLENTTHLPNIFISWIQEHINEEIVKEIYPNCQIYDFNSYSTSRGALIYARIMAKENSFIQFYACNNEFRSYNLKMSETVVITTESHASLPLCTSKVIDKQPGSILKVHYGERIDYFRLPSIEKFSVDFCINKNGIYSIKYVDVNNKILQPEEDEAKMESLFTFHFTEYLVGKVVVVKNALDSVSFKNITTEDISELDTTLQKLENLIKNLDSLENASSFKPLSEYYLPKKIQNFDPDIEAAGIDLGTTRCCTYVSRKNGIEPLALGNTGQHMLPSYVTFEKTQEICGDCAVDKMRTSAKATAFDAKRMIGKKYNEITIDKSWPFQVYDDGNRILIGVENEKSHILVPPLLISASLLAHMKQKIEEYQGNESNEVVITTPTAFTPLQNVETVVAGILSGWESVHLLPEPLAGAFAYFIDRTLPINSYLLLFDLGGGTLDVALLKVANDHIQIINTAGDSFLGGRDFDNLLIDHFQNKLEEDFNILINSDLKKYKLMAKCQKLKHTLSTSDEGQINVSDFNPEKEEMIVITKAEFQKMSVHLLSKIESVAKSAICNFGQCHIEKVLLAGGCSRMPMIAKLLKNCFPNAKLCKEENPEQVVARGAAYYAYYLAQRSKTSSKNDGKKKKDCTVM